MTLLKDQTFVCLDCELTGLDKDKDQIIEIGCISFKLDKILQEYESLVSPDCEISEASLAIHNINKTMLEGKPKFNEVLPKVIPIVDNNIMVGHGISFDIEMIQISARKYSLPVPFQNTRTLDTLRLARLYGDTPNNSLENLARHFNVKIDGVAHRAMTDVRMNIEVFKFLVRRYKTVQEVFDILARPIKMKYMPLGKYKGRLFSEIPLDYLQWSTKLNFDKDLLFTIQLELKKRKQGGQFSQATNPFLGL